MMTSRSFSSSCRRFSAAALALALLVACSTTTLTVDAQLTCALAATEESACLHEKDDSSQHCVWCSVAGIGFCATEEQAEAAEQSFPFLQCDRYSGNDDDNVSPSDDDNVTPDTDDHIAPNDDAIPDDFWDCLQMKTQDACTCTWCVSKKAGFGLCLGGPAAESAAQSDFFTCQEKQEFMETADKDPYDPNCLEAYLQDPSVQGCQQSIDEEGNQCEFCTGPGGLQLCLTQEQAQIGQIAGLDCQEQNTKTATSLLRKKQPSAQDPYDFSCALAFLEDQSETSCAQATDQEGNTCEFCQSPFGPLCLTMDQADMATQFGATCDRKKLIDTPYDPSCFLAFAEDKTKTSCVQAVDLEGRACEYCNLQKQVSFCLTEEQAMYGSSMGIECDATTQSSSSSSSSDSSSSDSSSSDSSSSDSLSSDDPTDPSCALAFLEDQSEEACTNAVDQDGNECEFCQTPLGPLCLNMEQAEIAEQIVGATCEKDTIHIVQQLQENNPYDPSCFLAFMQDQNKASCVGAMDMEGSSCQYCTLQGELNLCLTAEQAEYGQQLGIECEGAADNQNMDLPSDFFDCLENYDESGCSQSSCTWCDTEVGVGFCLSDAVAESTKECSFFDCRFRKTEKVNGIYDPMCLSVGMNGSDDVEKDCNEAQSSDGSPCVWCDAAGVFGLCLSSEQAGAAGQFLTCDTAGIMLATE